MTGGVALFVALPAGFAQEGGLDPVRPNVVSTALSERARSIIEHRSTRPVAFGSGTDTNSSRARVIACDGGSGKADVDPGLRDHYSTAPTRGVGLPGVKRPMDDVEIDRQPGKGTRVTMLRTWDRSRPRCAPAPSTAGLRMCHAATTKLESNRDRRGRLAAAASIPPHRTEPVSGDLPTMYSGGGRLLVPLVDLLGHGSIAAIAEAVLSSPPATHVAALMTLVHEALRPSDGAVVPIAVVDARCNHEAAAVGVVRVRFADKADQRFEWSAGAVGTQCRTLYLARGALGDCSLRPSSDGAAGDFELRDYLGTMSDSSVIASKMVAEHFGRRRAGVLCVVTRCLP